jgi:hypothetical protein
MKKVLMGGVVVAALVLSGLAVAAAGDQAEGHGTLAGKRQFSFNAHVNSDGSVTGQAELVNPNFTGANGKSPYRAHVEISCMKVIGNVAFFGGLVTSTNDTGGGVFTGAVYFSVQDNGEPGKSNDLLSPLFFFDDDPNTVGDPALCQGNQLGDFPMDPIQAGNIQVKPAS